MIGGLLLAIHYLTHPLGETPQFILSDIWAPVHFVGANSSRTGGVLQPILRQTRPLGVGWLPPSLRWWSQQARRIIGRRHSHRSSDRSASTITPRCRGFPLRSLVVDGRTYHSYLHPRLPPPCHCHGSFSYHSAYSPCSALVPLDGHPRRTASARLLRLVRHRKYCGSHLLSWFDRMGLRAVAQPNVNANRLCWIGVVALLDFGSN